LAQAAGTFDRNRGQGHFWNKTSHETWSATDSRGRILQQFPAVTVESVVRKDGTRCNAVVAWSDGVPAHLLRADEDARCASVGETESDKFEVVALFQNRQVRLESQSTQAIVLTVLADTRRPRPSDLRLRC